MFYFLHLIKKPRLKHTALGHPENYLLLLFGISDVNYVSCTCIAIFYLRIYFYTIYITFQQRAHVMHCYLITKSAGVVTNSILVCFNLIGTECAIPYNYNDMTLMWILHFSPFISDDLI